MEEPNPPLTDEQLRLLFEILRSLFDSPSGCGEVVITVQGRHVRFVRSTVSLDLLYPEQGERWVRGDKRES